MAKRRKLLTLKNGKYWSKKIRGKVYYFGTDYEQACTEYKLQKPFLEAGIESPGEGPSIADLLNEFLTDRRDQMEEGRLAHQTYNEPYMDLLTSDREILLLSPLCWLEVCRSQRFEEMSYQSPFWHNLSVAIKIISELIFS